MTHAGRVVGWIPALVALFVALTPAPALAQTETIEPKYVAVTRPDSNPAPLMCGAGQTWYPIEFLKQGQLLRADATKDEWYRVQYPAGVPAVVKLDEARYDPSTRTVTLTDASALAARNIRYPNSAVENYYFVFNPDLPAGTELPFVGELRDEGALAGYFVLPPEGAKGWVNRRHVRDATAEEVNAHLAALRPTPATPTERAPEPEPETPTATPDPIDLAANDDQPADDEAMADNEPEAQPDTPADESAQAPTEADTDDDATDEAQPEAPATDRDALYARLSELDTAYRAISSQQTEGAEITPLRAEYVTLRDDARAIADDAAMARMAGYAESMIALLDLRAEVQQMQAQLAELEEMSDANQQAISATRQQIMRARGYAMVGVLTRSSLYTGGELPLRYRLQSSSSSVARTLAYIDAPEGRDLSPLLGKEVGVIVGNGGITRSGPVPILRAEIVEEVPTDSGN